jgi:hypothetical protein
MLPNQVAGTTIDDVNRFSATKEELFRSFVSDHNEGKIPLGVFLRFRNVSVK